MVGEKVGDKVVLAEMYWNSYDWGLFALLRDDAGRLYTAQDRGCSCNGPWESPEYVDFNPVPSVQAAMERARKHVENSYGFSIADYESFVKEALEVR